jgi:hypothetical protein
MMGNEPSNSLLSYWLTAIFRGFFIIKQLMETSGDMLGNARRESRQFFGYLPDRLYSSPSKE